MLGEFETAVLGYALLGAVVPAGCWLAWHTTSTLWFVGMAGLLIGWAYSAPPLQLVARGLGELAITMALWLVVTGSMLVQHRAMAPVAVIAGLAYALLVANVLFINQFPDARSDCSVGKRTLVVRLGPERARAIHPLIAAMSGACILVGVAGKVLPAASLWALLALVPSGIAAVILWVHASQPVRLERAIVATIIAAVLEGLVLSATLLRD